MNDYLEYDYMIEAVCDKSGEFPLQCAVLLFDLLNIKGNIVIKNQYTVKQEKELAIKKYIENNLNCFFELPEKPEGNYCLWIREKLTTNQEIFELLKLQGIYLSYLVPTRFFNWEDFIQKWTTDERNLFLSDKARFICNIIDMDRVLNINFNVAFFSKQEVAKILGKWEEAIKIISKSSRVEKYETMARCKNGNKNQVWLSFW